MRVVYYIFFIAAVLATTELRQSDFNVGTYRILQPGRYVLMEDISFGPNANGPTAYDSCWVESSQFQSNGGDYGDKEYMLGFFAAITVETSDVEIDLNNHKIEQTAEHALLQRFFTVIELASSPFLSTQGPHTFTTAHEFVPATDVYIHSGTIGRSSHHGIHGNDNTNIRISNVMFVDYEVAGVALNGVEGFNMQYCSLTNRHDIPILGTFSAARFLQRYVDYLEAQSSTTTLRVQGTNLSITDIKTALKDSINHVHADIAASGSINETAHPVEHALFANSEGVIDGNSYGVLLNKIGVAVLGFPRRPGAPLFEKTSSDVYIRHVEITDQRSMIREVVALKLGGKAVSDSVGAILQLLNTHPPITISSLDHSVAEFTGNPVANAQIFVAKALLNGEFAGSGLDNNRNGIGQAIVDWVEAGGTALPQAKLDNLALEGWQCNGDSMAHVQKGAIGFKIDASQNVRIHDSFVDDIINRGLTGSAMCGGYEYSHPDAALPYYNGAHARGFSFAGSSRVNLQRCSVTNLRSIHGNAIGFDIFTDSVDVDLTNCDVVALHADTHNATGFHLGGETSYSKLQSYCTAFITAGDTELDVWDEDGVRNTMHNQRC